ncbi:hypothetical protein [Streptomyces sp. SBT349]|uniref:hypothetical protein n=1 Tax=Streptomyces sp. SBT349 TaxID=1580539 RepID=UPI00066D27F8|nr:hypothetical protein [Streptomyces sp. SBT349]
MKELRFFEVCATPFGTHWLNPDMLTGFTVRRMADHPGEEDEGNVAFTAELHIHQATYHLLDSEGNKQFWKTFEEAKEAVDSLLESASLTTPLGMREPQLGDVYQILDHEWEVVERVPGPQPAARIRRLLHIHDPLLARAVTGECAPIMELTMPFGYFKYHDLVREKRTTKA